MQENTIIVLDYLFSLDFLQIILEQFSKGVEHGHGHIHGSVPLSMLIGLGVHSFIEGMPGKPHHHSHMHSSLLSAIALHKIPVGIVLTHMLIESKMSKPKIILLISLFAITTPLGTFFSEYISNISNYYREIMAIVIGMFLHISTTILF